MTDITEQALGHSPLGKDTEYPEAYDPRLLCPISRDDGRRWITEDQQALSNLPFKGVDYWNAYEVSWLNAKGKPQVGILELAVPCGSPNIVESKSLKLYLNSLNQVRFDHVSKVVEVISNDLSAVLGASSDVKIHQHLNHDDHYAVAELKGECIDHLDIEVSRFNHDSSVLSSAGQSESVSETLVSHLLRSNCPVTGQPDWASVLIRYEGLPIDREALLKYIISYRTHNEFHEQCVERMFIDIRRYCQCDKLTVYARYTRRGGIDINPFRSNFEMPYPNMRLLRQ
ncbi:MAG: NADPH-dependent 7-cyano-7-deazaguanine reductase QueF [Pseudomonadales bacterium]|nr:NADPH-dependent 7-cyano-7-deazaguanine reductase QueF [Pseudomonadales bacterium]